MLIDRLSTFRRWPIVDWIQCTSVVWCAANVLNSFNWILFISTINRAVTNTEGGAPASAGADGEYRPRNNFRGAPRGDRGARGGRGGRGRGDNRGKRDFDRQSGSDKSGVKPVEKRDGSGPHNWGSVQDEIEGQLETTAAVVEETVEGETEAAPAEAVEAK